MGIMYVINVGFGLVGLQLVNVPMFFCIRRLVSPMILIVEFVTMGRIADSGTQLAVVLIVLGTLLAGYETLSADILGYALTFANNICTAAASILQKRFSDAGAGGAGGKVTTFTIVYYNSIVALPLAMLCIVLGGEISTLLEFPYLYDVGFWARYAVAVSMGLMLTYTSMLCTTYNSPLATSVTGNVKDIATTTLGYVMFPGFLPTVSSVSGLGLAFLGACAPERATLRVLPCVCRRVCALVHQQICIYILFTLCLQARLCTRTSGCVSLGIAWRPLRLRGRRWGRWRRAA